VNGGEESDTLWSVSPDGTTGWQDSGVALRTSSSISRIDFESHEIEVVVGTPFSNGAPAISPDGRWLLYHSDESGRPEVYVQSLGDDGGKWPISVDGGKHGRWTRAGREIVFRAADGRLMAVEVIRGPIFSAGIPEPLFDPGGPLGGWPFYDVTPDGNRFLVVQRMEQSLEPPTLVQNWASELER
jgi:hypothetical protein